MNYQETLDYLYSRLPVFQNIGARAFKPGLYTTRDLCDSLGNPQNTYPTIHIAGTNGKGSTSHMLAAILQKAGFKVGLYTSPHLKEFRERIRVNGDPVDPNFIVKFTSNSKSNIEKLKPSFFEVTVAMAFSYFSLMEVDVAVIEVGMGGRLDSTNIILPVVSIITNISLDHMQFLGNTLEEIASEKAGIIKQNVPIIISEEQSQEISQVFISTAASKNAPLTFGSKKFSVNNKRIEEGNLVIDLINSETAEMSYPGLRLDLTGLYQTNNIMGVMAAIEQLKSDGWNIPTTSIYDGLRSVVKSTGLRGRWQKLNDTPLVYCDTAHNEAGLRSTMEQFASIPSSQRRFVIGFVGDKDLTSILKLFPVDGIYYFCQPSNMRALMAEDLQQMASEYGLIGECFSNVNDALRDAISDSGERDTIYVGGSTFVVADIDIL